jgi:hypothetical protein
VRTLILTWQASETGPATVEKWHDPAGLSIFLVSFACLWLLAWRLRKKQVESPELIVDSPTAKVQSPRVEVQRPKSKVQSPASAFQLSGLIPHPSPSAPQLSGFSPQPSPVAPRQPVPESQSPRVPGSRSPQPHFSFQLSAFSL